MKKLLISLALVLSVGAFAQEECPETKQIEELLVDAKSAREAGTISEENLLTTALAVVGAGEYITKCSDIPTLLAPIKATLEDLK